VADFEVRIIRVWEGESQGDIYRKSGTDEKWGTLYNWSQFRPVHVEAWSGKQARR